MTETYVSRSRKKSLSKREWKRYLASLRASYNKVADIQASAQQAQQEDEAQAERLLDTSRETLSP